MTDSTPGPAAPLEVGIDGEVARLWLDRPARRNAFDPALIGATIDAIAALGADPRVRVVVIGGRGSAFCAGADLEWMARLAQQSPADNQADAEQLARLFAAIDACPKPTLARVHGACFGGGIGLVAACDIAVAANGASFCFPEVRIGLVPATIGPYALRAIGHRAASRYMLTAETFDAEVAARIGLVSVAVDAARLDATIDGFIDRLRAGAPGAQSAIKRLLRDLAGRPIDESLELGTAARIATARGSEEGREGLRAMLGKRAPAWATAAAADPAAARRP
jgi:methylglutaconyl-CoA hydratase